MQVLALVAGMSLGVPGEGASHLVWTMRVWAHERGRRLAGPLLGAATAGGKAVRNLVGRH